MKHQQVSVDYWAMGKAILTYGGLTVLGWIMMRLFNTVFTLPGKMRAQQEHIQNTLAELQRRFPDLNITEEDLQNAEQELEAFMKEENVMEKKNPEETAEEEIADSDAKENMEEFKKAEYLKKATEPPQNEEKKTI